MVSMRDVLVAELSDLLDAEEQVLRELPLMAACATSPALAAFFHERYRETQRQIPRLEALLVAMDERPRPKECRGMRGIIEDARHLRSTCDRGDVLDAVLVGGAERISHWEVAAYRSARTYSVLWADGDAESVLQHGLEEERRALHRLGLLAGDGLDALASNAPSVETPTSLMPGVWMTETSGFASVPPRSVSDLRTSPASELMTTRGEPGWRSTLVERHRLESGGSAMKERQRNEDARGGDVIVNDSIASGKPDRPLDRDPGPETSVAIDANEHGGKRLEEVQPLEKRN